MGQEGQALIFLTENEACYVDFLRLNKGLELQCYSTPAAPCVREQARNLIAMDRCELLFNECSNIGLYFLRKLYMLSVRAFVSFVRFYYKHECKLIFQTRCELTL